MLPLIWLGGPWMLGWPSRRAPDPCEARPGGRVQPLEYLMLQQEDPDWQLAHVAFQNL